jgi:hypothetical protein
MRVVDNKLAKELVLSKMWFYTDKEAKDFKEIADSKENPDERQIRRKDGERIPYRKRKTKEL